MMSPAWQSSLVIISMDQSSRTPAELCIVGRVFSVRSAINQSTGCERACLLQCWEQVETLQLQMGVEQNEMQRP